MIFRKIRSFFSDTIWLKDVESLPLAKRAAYQAARIAYLLFKGFNDERFNQQAGALTYVSFLSMVPLLAVLFSLAKGFGFQDKVKPWLHETVGKIVDPQVLDDILQYVENTPMGALGAIGFLVLLWTVLKTLLYLEQAFNQIWAVNRARPLWRALAYYLSVVITVPILIAASTTLMATFKSADPDAWFQHLPGAATLFSIAERVLPFGITLVAFTLVYAFMVNTHVRLLPTLIGGFVSSLLWIILQYLYLESNALITKNVLYGAFAFLPILLVFIYLFWLNLLFGCRIVFAIQNSGAFRRDRIAKAAGLRYRSAACILLLREIGGAFKEGKPAKKIARIAQRLDLSLPLTLEILLKLKQAGILQQIETGENTRPDAWQMVPARALETIALSEVIDALEEGEGEMLPMPDKMYGGPFKTILNRVVEARHAALDGITAADLLTADEGGDTAADLLTAVEGGDTAVDRETGSGDFSE